MKNWMKIFIALLATVFAIGCSDGGGDDGDNLIKGVIMTLNQNTGDFTVNTEAKVFVNFDPTEGDKLIIFGDDMGWCYWKLAVAEDLVLDYNANTKIASINLLDILEQGISRIGIYVWHNDTKSSQEFEPIIAYDLPKEDQEQFVRVTDITSKYGADAVTFAFNVDQYNGTIDIVRGQPVVARNYERSNCTVDADGDGYTAEDGDCNDGDANIYPGAYDVPDDGIDQDCSGFDATGAVDPLDIDDDGDGYSENGGDCNDNDANIYPGAIEICEDGIDQDCNGSDLSCEPTNPPVDENCVSAAINGNTLTYSNIYAGFQVPGGKIGPIRAVSEKTGWQYENGVSVSDGSVNLARLMFASDKTRFNLVMRVDGVDYWFISDLLCEESKTMLQHQTNSPEAPWADNDVVMALEDVNNPFSSWEVGYRG
ncbi:putative metal-binding motif-containing protein [bacterium]|nr:putative metal-binding motif-containing protein [bacterium]